MSRRVAVVTGAGRGVGAALVGALAAEGWSVVAFDRAAADRRLPYGMASERDLDAAVATAEERAGRSDVARAVVADAADEEGLASVIEGAEAWGDLDAFVANAGVIAGGLPAWELPADQQRALLEVNLEAVMLAARLVVPTLLGRPRPRAGRFVAVTSSGATRGMPGLAAYSTAKAGVEGFVRGLAADLHGSGVTANAVAPGSTDTPLFAEPPRPFQLPSPRDFPPPPPAHLPPPPAVGAPARARGGRRHRRLPARPWRRRDHRRHRPRGRRPDDLGTADRFAAGLHHRGAASAAVVALVRFVAFLFEDVGGDRGPGDDGAEHGEDRAHAHALVEAAGHVARFVELVAGDAGEDRDHGDGEEAGDAGDRGGDGGADGG